MVYSQWTTQQASLNVQRRVGVFVGSSAALGILQRARELVSRAIGSCPFVKEPEMNDILDDLAGARPNLCEQAGVPKPLKPDASESHRLIRWYLYATKGLLDLFDERELHRRATGWSEKSAENEGTLDAVYYLVCAIGAQACPRDMGTYAELLFRRGWALVAMESIENVDLYSTQSYALIAMYLIGANRWNAAFMSLGTAVRGAHALGLHRSGISVSFDRRDCEDYEQLWKVVRVLDLFLSLVLGRPLSTSTSVDQSGCAKYSASVDLCSICESVHHDAYDGRQVSGERQTQISEHFRRWAAEFRNGLSADRISPTVCLITDDARQQPNIGLYHLKQAYFVSIMVWTRSALFEMVSAAGQGIDSPEKTQPDRIASSTIGTCAVYADACVLSAIRCTDLLRGLLAADHLPKRLPFIVNSIFLSGLVLGVAFFGDLDNVYPIADYLQLAQKLLQLFSEHDTMADKYLTVIRNFHAACDVYMRKRHTYRLESFGPVIKDLFPPLPDKVDRYAGLEQPQTVLGFDPTDLGLPTPTAVNENTASLLTTHTAYWQDIMEGAGLFDPPTTSSANQESFDCSGLLSVGMGKDISVSLADPALFASLPMWDDHNFLPPTEATTFDCSEWLEDGLQSSTQVF
ncbi:fungal specific transcription factor domain-containing protein [Aspergillus lucknowensis]|uniref:Xylanolytic transcriptional activator regulatory domain-containing protein n=1 Tax=Aspergillus lucknowensis TaxID=176173 RepID=A0ABR4LH76_9EURO